MKRPLLSVFCFFLMLAPLLATATPVHQPATTDGGEAWWETTNMDKNDNKIADMVEKYHDHPLFLDEANTLPLIVDFDHTPTQQDVSMLEREVGFIHQWDLPLIDAVAGRIPHDLILETTTLPGVVMLELDGILQVQTGMRPSFMKSTSPSNKRATTAQVSPSPSSTHALTAFTLALTTKTTTTSPTTQRSSPSTTL